MSADAKAHLRHEILVGGLSNTVFNGLIAWLLLRNSPPLGWPDFSGDVLATALLLPLIVALIVIPLQRSKLRKGKLAPINLGSSSRVQSLADRFPQSTFKAAGLFGLLGLCLIAPLTLLGFWMLGVQEVDPIQYAMFKGLWAGAMAAVLVVPMVLTALREPVQA